MRFLTDESCSDGDIVTALRAAGHDVRAAADDFGGAEDDVLIEVALREARIIVTKDRDFGMLVFARGLPTTGIVYVRWPVVIQDRLPRRLVEVFAEVGSRLNGAFVVVRPDRVRVRRRAPQ